MPCLHAHAHAHYNNNAGDQIQLVHYVKALDHPCMVSMHENITNGEKVCRSKSCGPVEHCEIKHPHKKCTPKPGDKAAWVEVSGAAACETNDDPGVKISATPLRKGFFFRPFFPAQSKNPKIKRRE